MNYLDVYLIGCCLAILVLVVHLNLSNTFSEDFGVSILMMFLSWFIVAVFMGNRISDKIKSGRWFNYHTLEK